MKFTNQNDFDEKQYILEVAAFLTLRKTSNMPPIIIDLRSPEDFAAEHLIGAHSLPSEHLNDYLQQLPPYAKIVFYAENDEKAIEAVKLLKENNFTDLLFVTGGFGKIMEALKSADDEIFLSAFPEEEWEKQIEQVLTDKVRPALAADGGGLQLARIEGSKVFIHYQGACHGCPSAKTGTLNFIKNSLSVSLNHEIDVEIA